MEKANLDFNQIDGGELGLALVKKMPEITLNRIGDDGLKNAHKNLEYLNKGSSLKNLRNVSLGEGKNAIIIAAGPSLHKTEVAYNLKNFDYNGAIIVPDSAMLYCLRHEIIPDLVVTVDPHPKRIIRWFGDPELTKNDLALDDYFSRQDMDPAFANQIKVNDEVMRLLDKYGSQIKIALSTSSSESVVQRAINTGMEIYWWNPIYDDPDLPDSETEKLFKLNGLPCLNAGGNVGSACWMMADAVLDKKHVALTGMDFSYYGDTPYKNTQYYYEAIELVGEENLDSIYIRIFNPHIGKWFYTDPAYMWYRNSLFEMVAEASCQTYNCTGGGILFNEDIHFVTLQDFLTGKALINNHIKD